MKASSFVVALVAFGAPALVNCNAILKNDEVTLGEFEDASFTSTPAVDTGVPLEVTVDGALPLGDAALPGDDASSSVGGCKGSEKKCDESCVARLDPTFGCSDATCSPCALDRATPACVSGACAVSSCERGYANCDQKADNGCETDLSSAEHCGSCNAKCSPASPYCAPVGAGFACTTGCTPTAPTLCGTQCVDLSSSPTHCGSCSTVCPAVANGQVKCMQSACKFECNKGFHACGAQCVSNADVATCGASCTPCVAPANTVSTCNGTACSFVCKAGFHLCGGQCVSNLDPATCGASCTPCAGYINGLATCNGTSCGFSCDTGFHACGLSCVSNSSTSSCGTSCSPCPTPPNTTSTCNGTACGIACKDGFGNCDSDAANGCESKLDKDALNCGACGVSCGTERCKDGVCETPPPPQDSGSLDPDAQ